MLYINVILMTVVLFLSGASVNEGLSVGDTAQDFQLKNTDGTLVSLASDEKAKGYILVFTCNTCPYSVAYEDRIIKLHEMFASQGYPVIAIQPNDPKRSPGDSFQKMQQRAQKKAFPFAYLWDKSQKTTKAYGATNTPQVYVLNKQADNRFKIAYIGAIDNNSRNAQAADKHYVQLAVKSLIKGDPPQTTKTKAIGCSIKWTR